MSRINEAAVVNLLVQRFGRVSSLPASVADIELANQLINIIQNAKANTAFNFEESESLDFPDDLGFEVCDDDLPPSDDEDMAVEQASPGHEPSPYDYETQKRIVKYWREVAGGRSWTSMQNTFTKLRRFKTNKILYNWQDNIRKGGTRLEKLQLIYDHVMSEFRTARERSYIVHDDDIRRWALLKNNEVQLHGFVASAFWVSKFKKQIRAVSRKITRFVTSKYADNEADVINALAQHLVIANELFAKYHHNFIFNTDQSGFDKEQYSRRTLADKGSKHVLAVVQSQSALTHSYTIQPVVSMSGKLHKKLFIVLQEQDGVFGSTVSQTMIRPPNLTITASRSGKVTKDAMKHFYAENLMSALTGARHVLLHDAYGLFSNKSLYPEFPDPDFLTTLRIPEGLTMHTQPLDKFHFNQRKRCHKIVHKRVMQEEIPIQLFQRDNILKINSLIHHQFCAERFEAMNRYSWIACGYDGIDPEPEGFTTPAQYCFSADIANSQCHSCGDTAFMKCAWSNCNQTLCFGHWFNDHHLCNQDYRC